MSVDQAQKRRLQSEADKAVAEFLKGYIAGKPGAEGMGATAQVRVYKKRPAGFSRVPVQVVDALIASTDYRSKTNKQIVEGIQARFPTFEVEAGYLDRPLPKYLLAEVKAMLGRNGTPLDLKTYDSLSKIKRGLRGATLRRTAKRDVTVTVSFTDEGVIVGDRTYKAVRDAKGYRRIAVAKEKLRVDVLEALLGKPS